MRAAFAGRETHGVGPFLASITVDDDNAYVNCAVPNDGAAPSPEDVDALCALYRSRNRRPRVELILELAPAVAAAVEERGFECEARLPLMVLEHARETPSETFSLTVVSDRGGISDFLMAQSDVHGADAVSDEDIDGIEQGIAGGAILVLARDSATGKSAGAGFVRRPANGVAEIAGIGVREEFRRRGIGEALSARLGAEAMAAGVTVPFLIAAGDRESHMYERAGYKTIGNILHFSQP